jgi:hypothetical protein
LIIAVDAVPERLEMSRRFGQPIVGGPMDRLLRLRTLIIYPLKQIAVSMDQ